MSPGWPAWYNGAIIRTWSRFYLRVLLASAVLLEAAAAVGLVLAWQTGRKSIENAFHERGRAALEGMVRSAQRQLEVVENLQGQAPLDRDIRRYLVSRKAGSTDAVIRLEDAIDGLRSRILPVRVLENLAVYLVDEGILITALGAEEPRFFFDRYVYEGGSEALLPPSGSPPGLLTRRVTYDEAFPLIALAWTSRLDQRRVTTIAHLKPRDLLPEKDPGQGAFLVYCEEAGLLASSGPAVPRELSVLAGFTDPGGLPARVGPLYLYAAREEVTGWIFAYAAPAAHLAVSLRRFGLLTGLVALGVLSAAALVAFLIAGTVYRPVDAVLRRVFPDSRPPARVDEFEAIGGLFAQLRAQNLRLGDIVARARPTLRERAVRDIVSGRISGDEATSRLAEAELELHRPWFTLAVLSIGGSGPPGLLALVGREVMGGAGALMDEATGEIAETDDERIVVLLNHGERPDQRERIRVLVRAIQESVHQQLGVVPTAVVGLPCGMLAELPERYRQAMRSLESGRLWPPGILAMAEDAPVEGEAASFTYPVERERSIINSAVAGDCDSAARGLVAVLEANLAGRQLRGDARAHLLTAVAGTVVRICHRVHVDPDQLLGPGRDLYGAITGAAGTGELEAVVASACSAIGAAFSRERRLHDDHLRDRFREYIQANYRRAISLPDMAEAFGLTPSYLSELFKERMGENYIDYLTSCRMEVARGLLARTSARVNDVAAESGYPNVTSFIRVFRKREGVSPGAYRELHRRAEAP